MVKWAITFGFIGRPQFAYTYGSTSGRILRGTYKCVNGTPQPAASLRAATYRVTDILSVTRNSGLTRYGVPVYHAPPTVASLRAVERFSRRLSP